MVDEAEINAFLVKHPGGEIDTRVIGSIGEFILAVDHPQAAIDKMAHPDTNIVSLTITEGGYNISSTDEFDFTHPDVQQDLNHPESPVSVFGFLTAALRRRRTANLPAFTILFCDNVEHNGDVARFALLAFAREQDPDFARWIEQEVCFPNSMVDRITPVTSDAEITFLRDHFDLADKWPVTCEPFIQWVVEDRFSDGRPPLEEVGVQFVDDVGPYEKMKLRLLNAGHSVLGIPGAIHGHPTIRACMEDPVYAAFMRRYMDEEATPTLEPVAGIDLKAYKDTLEERFANPNILDTVARICSESSAKLPKFLIPALQANLTQGRSIRFATFILAVWCYYSDRRVNRDGKALDIQDAMQQQLHAAASGSSQDPLSFLKQESIFGDLISHPGFTNLYRSMIRKIYDNPDVRSLMKEMLEG